MKPADILLLIVSFTSGQVTSNAVTEDDEVVTKESSTLIPPITEVPKGHFVDVPTETPHEWKYDDQDSWSSDFPECGKDRQSPIDIQDICFEGSSTKLDESLSLKLANYESEMPASLVTLANNGHTATLTLANSTRFNQMYPMAALSSSNETYQFTQLHFHWDQNDARGSEHSMGGARSALEMHMVHWNIKYETYEKAVKEPDGLLVLVALYGVDIGENPSLEVVVDQLDDIEKFDTTTILDEPLELMPLIPTHNDFFYTYQGSLTTPPCLQIVTWVVFGQVQRVGYGQLAEFAKLDSKDKKSQGNTNRNLQPLKGRQVLASSNKHCKKIISKKERKELEGRIMRHMSLARLFLPLLLFGR